ncbi:MAG: DNA-binding transcriptional regulator DsdC [Deltaproteobacteria bacterium]|jgi:LysR family D-serine deaminase transcriptional activator|nr:DNA-binding transcriptional regulator DsdC [Deltaproteobacteria bacterium]
MNNLALAQTLPGMHYFYSAAQKLSFTMAAKDLCVTQAAVSHRIRQLESYLGFALFHRYTRRVALTDEGERLYAILSRSLHDLSDEINNIRHLGLTGSLSIHSSPSFAELWLVPRLTRFKEKHPGIVAHISSRNDLVDLETENVDIAIAYESGPLSGVETIFLMRDSLLPVCTPSYAAEHKLVEKGLAALPECTLLHDNAPWHSAHFYSEWQAWSEHIGLKDLNVNSGYSFNSSAFAYTAAKNGLGIAMGRKRLVRNDLATGSLVAPFEQEMPATQRYDIIVRKETIHRPRVKAFIDWLLLEAAEMLEA